MVMGRYIWEISVQSCLSGQKNILGVLEILQGQCLIMEKVGSVQYAENLLADFVLSDWRRAKMLNALIAALSNAIASCGCML